MKIFYLTFFVAIIYGQNSNSIKQATAALNAGMYEKALVHIKEAEKEEGKILAVFFETSFRIISPSETTIILEILPFLLKR